MTVTTIFSALTGEKPVVRRTEKSTGTGVTPVRTATTEDDGAKRDVLEVVSMENRRAMNTAAPRDLAEAEEILASIKGSLGQMTKSDLRGIHKLEGLVHYYTP